MQGEEEKGREYFKVLYCSKLEIFKKGGKIVCVGVTRELRHVVILSPSTAGTVTGAEFPKNYFEPVFHSDNTSMAGTLTDAEHTHKKKIVSYL